MTPAEREAIWQSLTLADDYLFCKIMSDKVLCAEMIRRIFPDLDVSSIKDIDSQKAEKLALHIRGVRFDVFTKIAQAIMDFEAQKKKLDDLFKRPRAYQTVLTYDELNIFKLKKSGNYKDLQDCYVVFTCTFDPLIKDGIFTASRIIVRKIKRLHSVTERISCISTRRVSLMM